MNSEVDFTFGFSRSIVATGTPDFDEMTPKVSPACTIQKRGPDAVVVVPLVVAGEVGTVVWGRLGAEIAVVVARGVPAFRPDRMSRTAIVAASRNAAGATYRRQSSRGTTSRMRSRFPA